MVYEVCHTNVEIWVGGLYRKGQHVGGLSGEEFHTTAQTVNNGYLIHKDTLKHITNYGITIIQFDSFDLSIRSPVDVLLEAGEDYGELLWCDKMYMGNPIKLEEDNNGTDVEESRWIQ